MKAAIILAAGMGVRMKSDLPKVFHSLCGRPMLSWVLDAVKKSGFDEIYVVVGYRSDMIKDYYKNSGLVFVDQNEQLGTAHAVQQVSPYLAGRGSTVAVLAGDMPLISAGTINGLLERHLSSGASATVLSAVVGKPAGYGRIVRGSGGEVERIVEEKDADKKEKMISEINTGIYCFDGDKLFEAIMNVRSDNAQKEFYLTDTVGLLRKEGLSVSAYAASDPREAMGVNTKEQLTELEKILDQ